MPTSDPSARATTATTRFLTNKTQPTTQADITHRAHAICETVWSDLIDGHWAHQPSGNFAANAAWTTLAAICHNLPAPPAPSPTPAATPSPTTPTQAAPGHPLAPHRRLAHLMASRIRHLSKSARHRVHHKHTTTGPTSRNRASWTPGQQNTHEYRLPQDQSRV